MARRIEGGYGRDIRWACPLIPLPRTSPRREEETSLIRSLPCLSSGRNSAVPPDLLQTFLDHDIGIDAVAAVRLGEIEQLIGGIQLVVEGLALLDLYDAERNRQCEAAAAQLSAAFFHMGAQFFAERIGGVGIQATQEDREFLAAPTSRL